MKWIDKLLGSFTKASGGVQTPAAIQNLDLPPHNLSAPPVATGEWRIIVDANGEEIKNRAPQAGDMLARHPVGYNYAGTLPVWERDKRMDPRQDIAEAISYEIRAERNKALLDKAVFYLSQTDDGARLLRMAEDLKFRIAFDPKATAEENALGICDYANKIIPLAEGRSAEDVALTLKHELQHMEDISKGLSYDNSHTLKSYTIANRALEGNGRVSEAVLAAELMTGNPSGPPQAFRTSAVAAQFQQKQPFMAARMIGGLPDAVAGRWQDFAAKVLPGYYETFAVLEDYDQRKVKHLHEAVPDLDALRHRAKTEAGFPRDYDVEAYARHIKSTLPSMLTQDVWTHEKLTPFVTIKGHPYLDRANGFDTEAPQNLATTEAVKEGLDKIHTRIQAIDPALDKSDGLELPVRNAQAVHGIPSMPRITHAPAATNGTAGQSGFASVILPKAPHVATSGETGEIIDRERQSEASYTENFLQQFQKMQSDNELHKLHMAGEHIGRDNATRNWRGVMHPLLEAGLRAPIAAFPDDYLFDLRRRITGPALQGKRPDLSTPEIHLLQHWQTLKDKGLDPVSGNDPAKGNSAMTGGQVRLQNFDELTRLLQKNGIGRTPDPSPPRSIH